MLTLVASALAGGDCIGDADTTAAIYGQIAGAHYGVDSIPLEWRERLTLSSEITAMADSLWEHAKGKEANSPSVP